METQATSRRGFYSVFINGLSALMGLALAVPAAAYLLIRPKLKKGSDWVDAAQLSTLQIGEPQEVVFRRSRVDGWRVLNEKATAWVVRMGPENVIAYSPSCTHLGCAYHWDAQAKDFLCPCHTSVFSIDGKVLAGPAPRPLDRYLTRVDNGKLLISPTIQNS
jgi:menaquinol-cytochrome c reductase iron-sulfur subunit